MTIPEKAVARVKMMASSNILAEAIGRVMGIKILQTAEWRDN